MLGHDMSCPNNMSCPAKGLQCANVMFLHLFIMIKNSFVEGCPYAGPLSARF